MQYEEARSLAIDGRPSFIARCADVADVIACVNFAREEGSFSRCAAAVTTWQASRQMMAVW
jgi:hypothetical protein